MSEDNLNKDSSVAIDLLDLYDEFAEFESYCAFFCDALACLGSNKDNWLDSTSAEGLDLFSHWLKHRAKVLKVKLDHVRQHAKSLESSDP